jgi:hypothetical protein
MLELIKGANLVLRFVLVTVRPWRPGLLGLQDRKRNDCEDRAGSRRS